ncbi:MAG: helix-turn-helix transcriptional regulator [Clostridia bacterium]|nr:helix-turn-helix transcriptional regulator [Clostridia bacterium]
MELKIGTNIKRLRTAKNLTQEQLSAAMNVTCAAVSKWERGESFPDITLLQPLAYYFGVTLDELMGYDREKVHAEIEDVITLYRNYWKSDYEKARNLIVKAYHDYPNDYWIMHYYMWNIGGDMADNDPNVLLAHKEEFLAICEKILEGCQDENIRLNAWNMRAKILHAEGRTEEALEIYRTKFTSWYSTTGQKSEQLFAKDTPEYLFHVHRNAYELAYLAADKLGRTVFFDRATSMEEKTARTLQYGSLLLNAYTETGDDFFLTLANGFLERMENDLSYRGGTDEEIIAVMEKHLAAVKTLTQRMKENDALYHSYDGFPDEVQKDILSWNLQYRLHAKGGRRAELLQNPAYTEVLKKYR